MGNTGNTNPAKTLMVICEKRHLENVMQEFEDWKHKEGIEIKVALYGTMQKSNEGFVVFTLKQSLPEGVYTNLMLDDDIIDYAQYYTPPPTTETPA